jgi:hypothetical protein
MLKIKQVNKSGQIPHTDIIRLQLVVHAFFNNLEYSKAELECLALLSQTNEITVSAFCNLCVEKGIFKTGQSARNFITKIQKVNTIIEKPGKKKTVLLNPELGIIADGNILLNYKFVGLEVFDQQ